MRHFLVPADRKGGKVLISDEFRYRRKSRSAQKFYWMCTTGAWLRCSYHHQLLRLRKGKHNRYMLKFTNFPLCLLNFTFNFLGKCKETYVFGHRHRCCSLRNFFVDGLSATYLILTGCLLFSFSGFHSRWSKTVGVRHPNLWVLIRKLKDEQRKSLRMIHCVERGDAPPPTKLKYRKLQERRPISRLKSQYVNGTRNLSQYWRAVSYACCAFN